MPILTVSELGYRLRRFFRATTPRDLLGGRLPAGARGRPQHRDARGVRRAARGGALREERVARRQPEGPSTRSPIA